MRSHCQRGHPLSGDNLRERWKKRGDKTYLSRECRACAAGNERKRYALAPDKRLHGLMAISRSIRTNMPHLVMSQAEGLFYSKKGCHPNSALGRAITGGDATARLRVKENRNRDARDRAELEWWAGRGFRA